MSDLKNEPFAWLVEDSDRGDLAAKAEVGRRMNRGGTVECSGCKRRGVKEPNRVKAGTQCGACADIEEGAY